MQFKSINTTDLTSSDCLCIGMYSDQPLSYLVTDKTMYDMLVDKGVRKIIEQGDFTGDLAQAHLHTITDDGSQIKRILLIGLGKFKKLDAKNYDKIVDTTVNTLSSLSVENICINFFSQLAPNIEMPFMLQQMAFKFVRHRYQFNEQVATQNIDCYPPKEKKDKSNNTLQTIKCTIPDNGLTNQQADQALTLGAKLGEGVNTARFLGDLPANICTPTYLADYAQTMGKQYDSLKVRIKNEDELSKLGMEVFLSVGRGSIEESKFIEIEYTPKTKKAKDAPIILVGKGVTFDTGGISLKPSAGMDEMKYDMCGAASVMGTMRFLAETNVCQNHIIGIIPATENMPSDRATKPGDVFKSYSGQTVEVLNTDAEGRLILADSLSYAEETYKPTKMINIATLTGACIIALGNHRSAVMSNDDELASELMNVGQSVLDPCWQLPLDDEYDELLHSNFADMANIGGRAAGSITAGCFLKRFVKNTKWAHLDIAGVAWLEGKKKGATGRPVPLLANWLLKQNKS